MIPNNFDRVGMTYCPEEPKVSRQVPPVAIALDQLEKELHYIREAVNLLANRLSPVMRPIPVSDSGGSTNRTAGGSPMTNQIDGLCTLARVIGADAHAILDCIEI